MSLTWRDTSSFLHDDLLTSAYYCWIDKSHYRYSFSDLLIDDVILAHIRRWCVICQMSFLVLDVNSFWTTENLWLTADTDPFEDARVVALHLGLETGGGFKFGELCRVSADVTGDLSAGQSGAHTGQIGLDVRQPLQRTAHRLSECRPRNVWQRTDSSDGWTHRFAVRGGGEPGLGGALPSELAADVRGLTGHSGAASGHEAAAGRAKVTRMNTEQGAETWDVLG